jgi:hypothetical protein
MDKNTQILEIVVRCKYFEADVHITNPIKNSYQDGLGRTTSKRRVDEELWERGHLPTRAKLSFISDCVQNIEIVDHIIVEQRRP